MNTLNASGKLTAQAETKEIGKGLLVTFTVADNHSYTNAEGKLVEEVEFHACEYWVGKGSKLPGHLTKGRSIAVTGRQVTNRWEDAEGQKRERKVIRVQSVDLL